jgi:hypothetical protein
VDHEQRDRQAAWLTALGLLHLVVVGVALTASNYRAVGIPLHVLVARPWWVATRSVQSRHRPGSNARGLTIVALAALTAGLVVNVLLGFDDLDTPMDVRPGHSRRVARHVLVLDSRTRPRMTAALAPRGSVPPAWHGVAPPAWTRVVMRLSLVRS